MIEYAIGQHKSNPDMAVDVLLSGLSYSSPEADPLGAARLHLVVAAIEAERNNWTKAGNHASSGLTLAAPRAAATAGPTAADLTLAAGSLAARAALLQASCGHQQEADTAFVAAAEAARAPGPAPGGPAGQWLGTQHNNEVAADALAGRAQLQMQLKEWGAAEELLGEALKAAEAAHGERSPALAPLLALLGYAYSRSARVTFAEGLFREAAKLLRLDPARLHLQMAQQQQLHQAQAHQEHLQGQQGGEASAAASAAARLGVHASVAAVLSWRYAQLLWVLPNRGSEASQWEGCARHMWAGSGPLSGWDISALLGGEGHLRGEGPEGSGLLLSTRFRRAWPVWQPPRPGLQRHALNSMIADYLGKVNYNYSLSVFKEESGLESRPLLTEDELLDVLKVDRETSFFQSYMKSKAHGGSDSCFVLNLLLAISEAAAAKGKESFTQTIGGDRYQMEVRMKQLEDEYQARLRAARMAPGAGMEERLALYRQEIEEQAAAEVARQVERIREMEVAAARLDEAAKARRAMEAERLELDRMHSERLAKLRQREEETMDKLRRQQRDVENVAYEHRQRILREEERMRNQKTEIQQQQDGRLEQLRQLERSLELRERAVAAREAAAEKRLAEATEAAAEAQVAARQDVEREYMELKSNLAQQRMQIEMDRSRIMELRSEATAEIAGARAKEERLRNLEAARAEAEARAAAHAADAEVVRLQAEKLAMELNEAREELSRRLAAATDGADAMLANAAGAMNMLNAEAVASRAAGSQIREAMSQLERAKEEAQTASVAVAQLQQEVNGLHAALNASHAETESLRTQLGRVESLMDEAVAARSEALSSLEEAHFRTFQLEREVADLRSTLARTKEDAAALRLQANMQRRPQSRGADSPNRRSITLSPPRRPAPGASTAAISALSLGLALGGGPGGAFSGGVGGQMPHGWQQWPQSGGGSVMIAGGTPTLSHAEFPIAAAPRDPTVERMDRLRRQEDIVAGQEDMYRKRMMAMQEVRDRSMAMLGQAGGVGGAQGRHYQQMLQRQQMSLQQQQQALHHQQSQYAAGPPPQYMAGQAEGLQGVYQAPGDGMAAPPPYYTYVMHGTPAQQQQHPPQAAEGLLEQQGYGAQPSAHPQQQAQREESPPESVHDVEGMLQAKMRMLQEQRERALAAQQQSQPPSRRLTSRTSRSSRYSDASGGGASGHHPASGSQPRAEDSNSALIAGEAYDTVAPELSTIQRRTGGGRRISHEGGGHLSRQSSSINRRADTLRGTSFARSEASTYSVEVPGAVGLSGNSQRAMSVAMTDDFPSSMENFELPGLNDDDEEEGVEAPGDDGHFGAFAAEFSAGSVF
ncbi:hypothetical protein GPECTOR_14g105 [Gonium pectorale]|uniref:Uncharacterized protein n=1 Tax=Gonium pectorale TaxID=33097 RepID=A0A150GLY4_GONPE|nr:hypothetical protein GPECTOR_14g105 [Gonium pectorale]|eukprot:KXZ50853.1 hypothetical protein GPECTOR_14g105 [Gonium pectorale]